MILPLDLLMQTSFSFEYITVIISIDDIRSVFIVLNESLPPISACEHEFKRTTWHQWRDYAKINSKCVQSIFFLIDTYFAICACFYASNDRLFTSNAAEKSESEENFRNWAHNSTCYSWNCFQKEFQFLNECWAAHYQQLCVQLHSFMAPFLTLNTP